MTHSHLLPSRRCRVWQATIGRYGFAVGLALGLVGIDRPALAQAAVPIDYVRQIRPLLSDRCYKCHGPDDGPRQGVLRFDLKNGAFGQGESGAVAIVAGKSAESELVKRITSADPTTHMPPADSGKSLTAAEIELLRTWIDQGATWKDHWSFVKPERPAPPAVPWEDLVRNPIDRFAFARLQREGLRPAPRADKTTLARRITLDLTGLPPTPAEVAAFLADESPQAYESVVDRLLQSTRYGEHMSRYWLDAVRYGDTHGLHFDNERSLWPYRDWVIGAFNRNLPFDQFTIEQLAGDLLPNASLDQKVASGFNRCNLSTSEGGSINEEVLVRYATDRTEAVSTVWLGLTLGCAVCHNHKYDPISQKEFYQFYAFFNSAADGAMDGNALLPPPLMKIPAASDTAQFKLFDDQVAAVRERIVGELAKVEYQEPPAAATTPGAEPREFVWIDDAPPAGAKLEGNSPWEFVTAPQPVFTGTKSSKRTSQGLSQHFFTGAAQPLKVGEGDKLFAYVYLDPANLPKEVMLQWNDGSWEHRATWGEDVIPWGAAGSASRFAAGVLPKAGEWVRLEVECAKVGLVPGALINGWAFTQHDGTCYWDKAGIVTRTPQDGLGFESLAAWEAYEKTLSKPTAPAPVIAAIQIAADQRNDDQKKLIRNHFLEHIYPKSKSIFAPLQQEIAELTKKRTDLDGAIPSTMIMADMPNPRDTFVLARGQYDKPGDKVSRGVPVIFPPLPADAPLNRLGLARWLVAPSHPLTARVTVNRFWQQVFGTGIVKTAEDFGSQGQLPTHPELLDWLATEFMGQGWNVKDLMKLILMSHTYQQSSQISAELAQRDPANELLARGPRFRLDGEVLRDSALAMSGLLVERVGGRSVKPYQPEGVWEAVAFVGSNTSIFKQDSGDALYRRSMYTFWKRTSPPPSLTTFDAPSRENCTVRRPRTNTPLQALVLLNDKQFVEAARKLAERMMTEGGATFEQRATLGFRVVTARPPTTDELAVLGRVFEKQSVYFQSNAESATKLLSYGEAKRNETLAPVELAGYTMIANLLLNLDEAVTKE